MSDGAEPFFKLVTNKMKAKNIIYAIILVVSKRHIIENNGFINWWDSTLVLSLDTGYIFL